MKFLLTLLIILFFIGCSSTSKKTNKGNFSFLGCGMSNEEIIKEAKKCNDAKMGYKVWVTHNGIPQNVICTNPDKEDGKDGKDEN